MTFPQQDGGRPRLPGGQDVPVPQTEFRILGPTEIWTRGVRVPLTAAKQRTVLAALLLSPARFVSDLWLAELLWGPTPPATKSAQLYTYVSRLRRSCEPGVRLVRRHRGYGLILGSSRLDWKTFQRLAEQGRQYLAQHRYAEAAACLEPALRLWRGPALADVTDVLARTELPLLEEARLRALDHRMEAVLALGRHETALPELTRLVAENPARESLRGHLMTALYRCDRQMDALRVYEQGRRVLQEELGVAPGASLRALHRAVLLEELPGPAAAEPLTLTVRRAGCAPPAPDAAAGGPRNAADSPWNGLVPAMLPVDAPGFVGRRAELTRVVEELRNSRSPYRGVVLTGAAGVGTSALAVRAGHACRDDFRQGQLYTDLRGEGGRAKDPLDVLGSFLRALMSVRGADLPATLEERVQLYRSALSRRRILVVLDNASDERQVRPLLASGPGCRVLISGGRRLVSMEGVRPVPVGRLDDREARELLASRVGRERLTAEPGATGRLLDLCEGLPLALRFCATRLMARPQWPVAALVDRLERGEVRPDEWEEGADELWTVLREGVMRLEPPLRPVLRALARTEPGSVSPACLARRLDWSEDRARGALEALVEAGLLEVVAGRPLVGAVADGGTEAAPGGPPPYPPAVAPPPQDRYRCTPLVRLMARGTAAVTDGP
ncbi:BTAD domain-containing putative transcriptional regulator [Streptomyces griseus]|uniref:BTAD domain-containing putative transcriptional regulator n=1 Tax=Streptomyces griseus TaxID=1911 RepID=UPI000A53AA3F|nr:BTAD domain-containing putative transcriptional regulator [Streptomyces griseus]